MKALLLSLLLSPLFVSSAFAQTSATFAEAPDALLQLLPIVIIFILFYFLLIRPQQKKKRKPLLTAGGYRGRNMKAQQNETTRIAIAAAIIQGSAYRRRILRKLKTRYRAYAPEIGIDLRVCSPFAQIWNDAN